VVISAVLLRLFCTEGHSLNTEIITHPRKKRKKIEKGNYFFPSRGKLGGVGHSEVTLYGISNIFRVKVH